MAGEDFGVGDHSEQPKGLDRLRLALEGERLDGLDLDRVAHEKPGLGPDVGLAGRSGLLEAGGDVDRVPGDEGLALAADDHLTRVDADSRL